MDDKTRAAMRAALIEISTVDEIGGPAVLPPPTEEELEFGVDELYAMFQKHGLLIIYAQP